MVSIKTRIRAFRVAFKGLFGLFNEFHFILHSIAFIAVVGVGIYFNISRSEWIDIFLISALVLSLEAVNSSIENLANVVHPDQHPIIGKCKDLAAAAVLISAIFALIIAIFIFTPYFTR